VVGRRDSAGGERQPPDQVAALFRGHQSDLLIGNHTRILPTLEGLAVEVLTALGKRDAAVRDTERRAGEALRTMTDDESLSVREAADWCGSGIMLREVIRLRRFSGGRSSSKMSRASGSDRASWSSFVTTKVSPPRQAARASRRSGRSRLVPVRRCRGRCGRRRCGVHSDHHVER
jgi:hypothetical protein